MDRLRSERLPDLKQHLPPDLAFIVSELEGEITPETNYEIAEDYFKEGNLAKAHEYHQRAADAGYGPSQIKLGDYTLTYLSRQDQLRLGYASVGKQIFY
jgi:hypothetical protein